jgi:hypothetical protein
MEHIKNVITVPSNRPDPICSVYAAPLNKQHSVSTIQKMDVHKHKIS